MIEARGLVKKYGALEAVAGIDLEVHAGEIFGFLGPNGAGKSTTISMLCTLLTPTAGVARVAGIDVMHDPSAVRQRIGLVFQDPSLDDQLTARENLEFHAFIYSVPAPDRRRRIDEMLDVAATDGGALLDRNVFGKSVCPGTKDVCASSGVFMTSGGRAA